MTQPLSDDQKLLRRMAKGDEAAFNALYERYQGPIYRFIWHMSGSGSTAEDVTQEVYMLLIRNPHAYDPLKGSVAGYLFGIARNLAIRRWRQVRLDEPLDHEWIRTDEAEPASDIDVLADLTRSEALESLRSALLALPARYREVVVLCDLEEMSYAAAAELLQCSEGTVSSRLHRARTMLRTRLQCHGCVR